MTTAETVYSQNLGADLIVFDRTPDAVYASQDGISFNPNEWHRGPEAEWVYVERRNVAGGVLFHGWVDSVSRKLLQAG